MSDVFIPVRNQEGCTHVKTDNFHEESEQVEKEIIPHNIESELLTSFIDLDINGQEVGSKVPEKPISNCCSKPKKLNWPPCKETQKEFRDLANSNLSQLVDLVPKFD